MTTGRSLAVLQFAALIVMALALVPGGAHLLELPNKMSLPPEQYMIVQGIYRGWALLGIVLFGALFLTGLHTMAVRTDKLAMVLSLVAMLCLAANLALFFAFTYPMNVASSNWTVVPPNFEAARRQWEYSHAINAGLTLIALASLLASVLTTRRGPT